METAGERLAHSAIAAGAVGGADAVVVEVVAIADSAGADETAEGAAIETMGMDLAGNFEVDLADHGDSGSSGSSAGVAADP